MDNLFFVCKSKHYERINVLCDATSLSGNLRITRYLMHLTTTHTSANNRPHLITYSVNNTKKRTNQVKHCHKQIQHCDTQRSAAHRHTAVMPLVAMVSFGMCCRKQTLQESHHPPFHTTLTQTTDCTLVWANTKFRIAYTSSTHSKHLNRSRLIRNLFIYIVFDQI